MSYTLENLGEQAQVPGAAQSQRLARFAGLVDWLVVSSVKTEKTFGFGAVETFLQVSRNQHATQRAEGWLQCSRVPTVLLLASKLGCTTELRGCL
jgi:hypothetical protein